MSPRAWRSSEPSGVADRAAAAPSDPRTWVELVWIERRVERWIRFGAVTGELILDGQRRRVGFAPGAVFAFVRWAANPVGTVSSRIDILQAVAPGGGCSTVPGVTPGAVILLRIAGWPRVAAVLQAIEAVERLGIDPTTVAPDHWRHLHSRLTAGVPARAYSLARHRAWRLRQRLASC